MEFTKKAEALEKVRAKTRKTSTDEKMKKEEAIAKLSAEIQRALDEQYAKEGDVVSVNLDLENIPQWRSVLNICVKRLEKAGWTVVVDYGSGDLESPTMEIS